MNAILQRLNNRYAASIAASIVILLAFAVRVHLLGAQSLWHDEGNSYVQAGRSLVAIAENAARDIHPPGYYWLLALWRALTGESEFTLRMLSTLAGTLTVACTFALGKRLYSALAGLAAALFVTLNTFGIYYAQEARMYALLALWSAAGMWVLAQFFLRRGDSKRWGAALALLNAAGLWTHYAYPFVMLAQGALAALWLGTHFFRQERADLGRRLAQYSALNAVTIALFLPWLPTALERIRTWPSTGQAIPAEQALATIFGWLTFGITYEATNTAFGIVLFLLLFGLLVERSEAHTPLWWRMLLPVVWALVPVGSFLALGLFREANLKFLLSAQIGVALWLARGLWVLWQGRITLVAGRRRLPLQTRRTILRAAASLASLWLTLNLWAGLNPLYHDTAFQRDNYRAIAAQIAAQARPGDAIILNAPNQQEVFAYYYRGDLPIYPLPEGLGGDDAATRAAVEQVMARHSRVFAVFWGETERDPQRVVESTLSAQSFEADDIWYGDVRLVRYVMPAAAYPISDDTPIRFGQHITLRSYALNTDTFAAGDVLQIRLLWSTDAPLDTRYVVTLQLLNPDGTLAAQRDSEPGGGLALTTTWQPDVLVSDNHSLVIQNDLTEVHYTLIIALYDRNNPQERLPVGALNYAQLDEITIQPTGE
ncbi:MAG: glycosyltransferase family 39 protein [Chloroflexi bacterium]|nr:glycosyltransferase family 39 protein [Chloroflexota bacterium]